MENKMNKKLLAGGAIALVALMVCLTQFNSGVQAADGPPEPINLSQASVIPLYAQQAENDIPYEDAAPDDSDMDMRINDTRMRWNGEAWEYSTDGGETWTDTAPDGVTVDENGGMTMWQGDGEAPDFDLDAFMQEVDTMIDSILSEANERYGSLMPEDAEGGSFFNFGGSIARQVDGVWEYSSDGGETWTNEPPEGFEVSEDGTRFRIGGGDGDINDFDVEAWFEEWYNEWNGSYENSSTKQTAQTIAV